MRRRHRINGRLLAALALAGAAAAPIPAHASAAHKRAGIDVSRGTVVYGKRIAVGGAFPGAPKRKVRILFRATGQRNAVRVSTVGTDPKGRFSTTVKPRRSGAWHAELARRSSTASAASATAQPIDPRTPNARVRVRSRIQASVRGRNARIGHPIRITGFVKPGGTRRVVVRSAGQHKATHTRRDGHFRVKIRPRSVGEYKVRVSARGNRSGAGRSARAGRVTIYRAAEASWYGPGFYGSRTACGQTLSASIVGVANKTLPCGTKVKLRYRGHTVRAKVIDRGPYAGNREYDLTYATKRKLGFGSTGTVLSSR